MMWRLNFLVLFCCLVRRAGERDSRILQLPPPPLRHKWQNLRCVASLHINMALFAVPPSLVQALNNSYMLYYICPMHTLFTVMVYAGERGTPGFLRTSWPPSAHPGHFPANARATSSPPSCCPLMGGAVLKKVCVSHASWPPLCSRMHPCRSLGTPQGDA